jgi:hypothetical protein
LVCRSAGLQVCRSAGLQVWEDGPVFVTNHVLSGVLIGQVLEENPMAAFAAGVVSHLALDAIPHWGCAYPTESQEFLRVARRDGVLGLLAMAGAALLVNRRTRRATVAAMAGAVLLDLDKPLHHFIGRNPFPAAVQRFHVRIQNESLEGLPNEFAYGMVFAAADVAAVARRRGRSGAN